MTKTDALNRAERGYAAENSFRDSETARQVRSCAKGVAKGALIGLATVGTGAVAAVCGYAGYRAGAQAWHWYNMPSGQLSGVDKTLEGLCWTAAGIGFVAAGTVVAAFVYKCRKLVD